MTDLHEFRTYWEQQSLSRIMSYKQEIDQKITNLHQDLKMRIIRHRDFYPQFETLHLQKDLLKKCEELNLRKGYRDLSLNHVDVA